MGISPELVAHRELSQESLGVPPGALQQDLSIQPQLPEQPLEQLQEDLPAMENMGYDQVSLILLLFFTLTYYLCCLYII